MREREKVFVVEVGYACNNNCLFCMEARRYPKKEYSLKDFIKARERFSRVNFARKEPTLNKDLFKYLKFAKISGFERIELTTNGRLLSIKSFAEKLADYGVNVFQISLHAMDQRLHDALTRTPKSFEQTMKGIKNLMEIRKRKDIRMEILMTVTKLNIKEIPKMMEFCSKNDFYLVLNVFDPRGEARKFAKLLLPKYSEVIKYIKKGLRGKKVNMAFSLPLCTVPKEIRNYCSNYEILFDQEGRKISEERRGKIFIEKCKSCTYRKFCDGVWKDYIKIYGDEEIRALGKEKSFT